MRRTVFYVLALLVFTSGILPAADLSGRRAPGFALPDSNFIIHDPQDYRGKLLIVEIMQTQCPHCQAFSQVLESVKKKYGNLVAILNIVNPPDNQTTVADYIKQTGTTSPVLFDCGQVSASYLKVTPQNPQIEIPHVFLIDADGMIRKDFAYSLSTHDIFEGKGIFPEIEKLLKVSRAGTGEPSPHTAVAANR